MAVASVAGETGRRTAGSARLLLATAFAAGWMLAASLATPASAADCPGNPDALGTSRVLVVDPTEHPRVGTMQYHETLPLKDHEVVLTFDDGPLPAKSNKVLEILASECVKATFFTIGRMATAFPEGVRKLRDAGHTIGTHTENHPLNLNRVPVEKAIPEIENGIAHTAAALGDPNAVAPFFRIPGLMRADGVENYLASRGIMTWSADFPADDWRPITSAQVLHFALSRLEAKGKGILLLHDIQARTVAMLPTLLRELKARGYHIVHVVPATPNRPKTPTEPRDWLLHPDATASWAWPPVPHFAFVNTRVRVAPDMAYVANAQPDATPQARADRLAALLPLRRALFWPRPVVGASPVADRLPAPDKSLFDVPTAEIRLPAGHHQHVQLTMPRDAQRLTEREQAQAAPAAVVRRQLPGSAPMLPVGLQRRPDSG